MSTFFVSPLSASQIQSETMDAPSPEDAAIKWARRRWDDDGELGDRLIASIDGRTFRVRRERVISNSPRKRVETTEYTVVEID